MKKSLAALCYALLFAAVAVYAQNPGGARHPNIARAQSLVDMAQEKILDAQRANEYDLGGHAAKAKSLLEQASNELKLAAAAASKNADNDNNPNVDRPEDTPDPNVSASRHPNLAKAQNLIERAYASVIDAQKANEYDLGGHAAKAKTLLEQATSELKLAAEAANDRK